MSLQQDPATFACNECPAGMMHLQFITYFTWLDTELVTVPNFPAWVCDVCGKREYDERAVNWLTTLLSPNAGQTTIPRPTPHRAPPVKRGQHRPSSTE
jgi:YgiT-type zinc finger domain-containing protein